MKTYECTTEVFRDRMDELATLVTMRHSTRPYRWIFGVPRGGAMVAIALSDKLNVPLWYGKDPATLPDVCRDILVVDDIIDSGNTRQRYAGYDFGCLIAKYRKGIFSPPSMSGDAQQIQTYVSTVVNADGWVHFFWEPDTNVDMGNHITRILEYIGEDPIRDGLVETPQRVVRSWDELFAGYRIDIPSLFKTFDKGDADDMVVLKNIELYSMCEHHMLPFVGRAHIGYIPRDRVIGISKLARLVDAYARRLQVQERLGEQISSTIMQHLNPLGCACVIEAEHYCMRMRGCNKQNSVMTSSSLKGCFKDITVRSEFLKLIGGA